MKKHIRIKDSYKVWSPGRMLGLIYLADSYYGCPDVDNLNTTAIALEWWLHNIAYWITLPFIRIPWVKKLNERAKHVDLKIEYGNGCYNCKHGEWLEEDCLHVCTDESDQCNWEPKPEEDV